ncbi:type II toxin-antitoxin system death-on-curing family toxin [Synergistes jonesii]|uniref:type II toxin-antitoxin system death-on-curing family toxin n=1 Tax=Synergistes jonesii TaxID=2754 RepID=UPI00248E96F6|nr:type II toxin-antitoxin system death-on-curing family toxin [Synergistes jonesii]
MKKLDARHILLLHEQLIKETGGAVGVRDKTLLESAIAAPFVGFGDKDAYPSLLQKAARLGYGLVQNHAFIDGNKRIAAHAMLLFLAINGVELRYAQHELSDIFLKLAAGEAKYEDILTWLIEHEI